MNNLNQQEIIRQFQTRRKLLFIFFPAQMLGAVICIIVIRFPDASFMGLENVMWGGIGLLLVLFGILMVIFKYRCPACNKIPMVKSTRGEGADPSPENCPHCGVQLR